MTSLSVNVNKIATLRNARGGNDPDIIQAVKAIQEFGVQRITVHPRPDERHIRYKDVYDLSKVIYKEFNIEGYPSDRFINLVCDIAPTQVTLVPDAPDVLTSNAGWDTVKNKNLLKEIIAVLKKKNIRTSLFVDTDERFILGAIETGTDRIELYTENYASRYKTDKRKAIQSYIIAAKIADDLGLGVNAGHDLNLENLQYFKKNIHQLLEVSIGHALISDALYFGLEQTIIKYLDALT